MKKKLIIVLFFLSSIKIYSQEIKIDTTEVDLPLTGNDTIVKVPIELEEVYISNKKDDKYLEDRKKFLILQRRVLKVYPYAKIASERLTELNEGLTFLKTNKEKKKYFKIVENYLTNEFESQLKKLSRNDGKILVKLIHRQTGFSTFELIKDLKSGWKAFWSNNTAKLFDINLKSKYNPYDVTEDFLIEGILVKAFTDYRLEKQKAKIDIDYSLLAKTWKEKLKKIKKD